MKRILLAAVAAPLIVLLSSCAKDINNKEDLRTALIDYYNSNQDKMGLSMSQMDVEIGSMSFQKDQAQATVIIKPKAGGEGMTMSKVFERKGDKWVVRGNQAGAPGSHGAGQPMPSSEPAPARTGELPAGHPKVGTPKQ